MRQVVPVSSYTWMVHWSPERRMTSPTRLSWPTLTCRAGKEDKSAISVYQARPGWKRVFNRTSSYMATPVISSATTTGLQTCQRDSIRTEWSSSGWNSLLTRRWSRSCLHRGNRQHCTRNRQPLWPGNGNGRQHTIVGVIALAGDGLLSNCQWVPGQQDALMRGVW